MMNQKRSNRRWLFVVNKALFKAIIALSLLIMPLLFAQDNYQFEHFSIPQGLSNPTVNSIVQDNDGYLWIATDAGLNRFDGYDFKIYNNDPTDSTSLPNDFVLALLIDNKGDLWLAGASFVARYNNDTDNFSIVPYEAGSNSNLLNVVCMFQDTRGRIWVGSSRHGVHLYDSVSDSLLVISKKDSDKSYPWGMVFSFTEAGEKRIFAADTRDGVYFYNENIGSFDKVKFPENVKIVDPYALGTDDYGLMWISDAKGLLYQFDPTTERIKVVDIYKGLKNKPNQGANRIYSDSKGFLWLADNAWGLFRVNPVNEKFSHYMSFANSENSISANTLNSVFEDKYGILWIGTFAAGLNKLNPNRVPLNVFRLPADKKLNVAGDLVNAIVTNDSKNTKNNSIWFGTNGNGLFSLTPESNKLIRYVHSPNDAGSISDNRINSLAIDQSGNLWIGTSHLLNMLEKYTGKIHHFLDAEIGLSGNQSITDIEVDNTGTVWLATGHGVDIFLPKNKTLRRVPSIANRKYDDQFFKEILDYISKNEKIVSIVEVGEQKNLDQSFSIDKKSKILVVCSGEGRISNEESLDFGWLEDESSNSIWDMKYTKGTFHTGGGIKNRIKIGVLELDPGNYKANFISDQGHSYGNWNVNPPADSALYGIQILPLSDQQYEKYKKQIELDIRNKNYMQVESVNDIHFSERFENILWMGTSLRGLIKYNIRTKEYKQYFPFDAVNFSNRNSVGKVFEDSQGLVWFRNIMGLGRFDPGTEEIRIFTQKDGLPTEAVRGIEEDIHGNLWISTSSGLSKYVRNNFAVEGTFVNLSTRDGLQGFRFSKAIAMADDGEMYFGGANGINYFYPVRTNQTKPTVVINDFKISGKSVLDATEAYSINKSLNYINELELPHDMNDISLDFASIHLSSPEKNRVAYKLEGYSDNWIFDNRRHATFTNLDPGNYIFKVKGSNSDGVWVDQEKQIFITILQPWWQTWWAYSSYLFFFLLFLYTVRRVELQRQFKNARLKESELKAKAAELQAKAAEAQSRAVQAENERKSIELEEARALQMSLLPKDVPLFTGLEISTYMKTATEVGGDYYDFSIHEDGSLIVAIGDATGHGMKAGTLVTAMKSLFTTISPIMSLDKFFQTANKGLKEMHLERVMMGFASMKFENGIANLINAGMPPIYHFHAETGEVEEIKINGMPLGAMAKSKFENIELKPEKGDSFLMLSDGMPELRNKDDEMFGYERLSSHFRQVAEKPADEIIEYLKNAGSEWVEDADPDDDVTFVVIKII